VDLCNPSKFTHRDYKEISFLDAILSTVALLSPTSSLFFTIAAMVWAREISKEQQKTYPSQTQDVELAKTQL